MTARGASTLLFLAACQSVVVDVAPSSSGKDAAAPVDTSAPPRDATPPPDTRPICAIEKTVLENGLVCWTCADESQVLLEKKCRALAPNEPPPGLPLNCGPGQESSRVCKVCRDEHNRIVSSWCEPVRPDAGSLFFFFNPG
jgi:hypothetical protein